MKSKPIQINANNRNRSTNKHKQKSGGKRSRPSPPPRGTVSLLSVPPTQKSSLYPKRPQNPKPLFGANPIFRVESGFGEGAVLGANLTVLGAKPAVLGQELPHLSLARRPRSARSQPQKCRFGQREVTVPPKCRFGQREAAAAPRPRGTKAPGRSGPGTRRRSAALPGFRSNAKFHRAGSGRDAVWGKISCLWVPRWRGRASNKPSIR